MYTHPGYPNLFSPLKVNKLVLKNRIFYAPVEAYHDRAISGCAVMMRGTSGTLNDPRCRVVPGSWMFAESELPRVKSELTILKRAGAITSLEICHAGMHAHIPAGDYAVGPSDGIRDDGVVIKSMDRDMMDFVIEKFAETALCAKKIGYDMITMHFAHGWLPAQFFSPAINKRSDRFGGSFENRFRFPKMILKAVREAVGNDFAIDMRISAHENFEGCASFNEIQRFICGVSEENLINLVNISFGSVLSTDKIEGTPFSPDMYISDYAAAIKSVVNIPVAVVGKIMTPDEAEYILAQGKADAVVIGRASIADPWWAKKAFECRSDDIVPCIECGMCFDKRCSVQLRNYLEDMIPIELTKSATPQKVVIVGGGPAGMKAAITASQRGHDVVLYEKSDTLGGLTVFSDYDDNKIGLRRYKDYLKNQLHKSNVKILMNVDATPELVTEENPDHLILAMGSSPIIPEVPGVNHALQITNIYAMIEDIGKNVVIIGGGMAGSELAITLALRNHNVTIVEKNDEIGGQNDKVVYPTFRPYHLLPRFVKMMPNTECIEIKKDAVITSDINGVINKIPANTIVLAVGFKSNNENLQAYFGVTPHTTVIGDLRRPATIRECEEEGYFAVSEI